MKKLVIAIVLLVASVTSAKDFSIWALADTDSVIGRIGYAVGDNIEAGLEGTWANDSKRPGQIWGVYGVYVSPTAVSFDKIFDFEWAPELDRAPRPLYVDETLRSGIEGR